MIRLGIRAHDLGRMDEASLAHMVKTMGFDGLQLVFKKAIDHPVDFNDLTSLKMHFTDPSIMMLGAYFNPIHPDLNVVKEGINAFKKHVEIASLVNVPYVGSETGSYMGSPWGYVKENHSEKALDAVIDIFKDLVSYAEQKGCSVAVEGAYAHAAYSPHRIKKMLDDIASPNLKVTLDLFNFLSIDNHAKHLEIFDEALRLFKDDIVIMHLKDYVVNDGQLVQVGLGQGLMDYKTIISRVVNTFDQMDLIFEGVIGQDIPTSLAYIKELMKGA